MLEAMAQGTKNTVQDVRRANRGREGIVLLEEMQVRVLLEERMQEVQGLRGSPESCQSQRLVSNMQDNRESRVEGITGRSMDCGDKEVRQESLWQSEKSGSSTRTVDQEYRSKDQWIEKKGQTATDHKDSPSAVGDMGARRQAGDDCSHGEGKANVAGRMGTQVRDGRAKPKKKVASAKELLGLLNKQEHKCAISGRPLTIEESTLDHIHYRAGSLDDSIGNVQWIHAEINKAKNTMSVEDFVAMCKEVAQWNQ